MKHLIKLVRIGLVGVAGLLAMLPATRTFASTLTNGLVGYWPLDNAVGCNNETPDLVHGYNLKVGMGATVAGGLVLTNFNANLYLTNDAIRGNAVYVNNGAGGPAMFLAYRSINTNDLVPVTRRSPGSNTVSFWMKTNPDHPAANNDQRVFCESEFAKTLRAVYDISPVGTGYDIFLRQDPSPPYGNFTGGSHTSGSGVLANGAWHNVTLMEEPDGVGTNSANYRVYIDGVMDPSLTLAKPNGLWKNDTVGLFALVRGDAPAGFITNCFVDDFAEWERPLTTNEIQEFIAVGITNVGGGVSPLSISAFSSDLFTVVQGTPVTLSWQVNSDATGISIDNGIGNLLPISSCGVGSTNLTVNATTTYTITAVRGTNTVSKSLTIKTVAGVAPGWNYVGGFDDNELGNLGSQGNWQSLFTSPITSGYGPVEVVQTVTGNRIAAVHGGPAFSAGLFGSHSSVIGSSNTLFFRFYIHPDINTNDTNLGGIPDADINIGASDSILFDLANFTGVNQYNAFGTGPAVRIIRQGGGAGGPIDLTANWGAASVTGFSYTNSIDPNGLKTGAVYNVWIDMYNTNNDATANVACYYSVSVQIGGDSGVFTNLFTDQISDRSPNSNETLNKCFIAANSTAGQSTNLIRFDDFYLSSGGYNHTLPVPQGSFVIGAPVPPTSINITNVTKSGSSVTLAWSASPAGSYTYSVLSRQSLSTGGWTTNSTGLTTTSVTLVGQSGSQSFYRVTSP